MGRLLLFEILFLWSCGYALWRGGSPERIAAISFLIAATATAVLRLPWFGTMKPFWIQFQALEVWVAMVDVAVLAAMLWLAFAAERFWPIWMAAMAGIVVFTHMSMLLRLEILPWAYWRSQALWSYPMQLLLAVATWRHRDRLRRFGADPSWKRSYAR